MKGVGGKVDKEKWKGILGLKTLKSPQENLPLLLLPEVYTYTHRKHLNRVTLYQDYNIPLNTTE